MKISIYAKGNYFSYYGQALKNEFQLLGHEVIHDNIDQWPATYHDSDLHIIVNPVCYSDHTIKALPGKKIAILTEPLPNRQTTSVTAHKNLQVFERQYELYDHYVEWSYPTREFLVKRGYKNIDWFPHGYIETKNNHELDFMKKDSYDYDVLFLGDVTRSARRQNILNYLHKAGLKIFPCFENVWGDSKIYAILNSRIILNVHFEDHFNFETPRIFEAGTYNKFLISETLLDFNIVFGKNSIMTVNYGDLVETIIEMNRPECREIRLDYIANLARSVREYPISRLAYLILEKT